MVEQVNQVVDVLTVSKHCRGIVMPILMRWKGKVYKIRKLGLRHPVREGKTLFHIFEATDGQLFFRLKYDTDSLQWTLEAIHDGLPG